MGDKETGSLWSHILGKSMSGKMKGQELTILPAMITTWAAWTEEHPDTTATILSPTAVAFTKDYLSTLDRFCVGLVHGDHERHWRFDLLNEHDGPVNDQIGTLDVVVHFAAEHGTATVWERKTGERTLTFIREGRLIVDAQTRSKWDLRKGLAVDGELKGSRLKATTAIASFTNAWKRFHTDGTTWGVRSP